MKHKMGVLLGVLLWSLMACQSSSIFQGRSQEWAFRERYIQKPFYTAIFIHPYRYNEDYLIDLTHTVAELETETPRASVGVPLGSPITVVGLDDKHVLARITGYTGLFRISLHTQRGTIDDVAKLPFVEQVVTESMRLYPPAWIIGRRALVPYEIDGYRLPARSILVFSPYLVQRDARWFHEPTRFMPERWTPAFKASLPQFAYMPFGGGPRRCIGDQFAWTELILVASTIAQRWKLRLVPGHPVAPQAVVTLRLKHGLKMTLHARE